MKQRIFDVLGIGCLVVALLISILWVESHWYTHYSSLRIANEDKPNNQVVNHYFTIFTGFGEISFSYTFTGLPNDLDIQFQGTEFQFKTTHLIDSSNATQYLGPLPTTPDSVEDRFLRALRYAGFSSHHSLLSLNFYFAFPLWFFLVLTGVPGLWRAWHIKNRRMIERLQSRNLCAVCGYDLRASTDFCPECHTPIPPKPALHC